MTLDGVLADVVDVGLGTIELDGGLNEQGEPEDEEDERSQKDDSRDKEALGGEDENDKEKEEGEGGDGDAVGKEPIIECVSTLFHEDCGESLSRQRGKNRERKEKEGKE